MSQHSIIVYILFPRLLLFPPPALAVLLFLSRFAISLVVCCSIPVFGGFLRLWSVVVRKNPSWEKTYVLLGKPMASWEKPLGKPMAYLGKTYFRGRSLSCIFIKTHDLVGKKFFRKTHSCFGKNLFLLVGWPSCREENQGRWAISFLLLSRWRWS